ncbi:MAG: hypothetical protein IJ352_01565 [Muribaculaceae bacterium]|nr:hypothetical protein [Muribaculaceae bacterium]
MSNNNRIIVKKSWTTHDPISGATICETTTSSTSCESSSNTSNNNEPQESTSNSQLSSNSLNEVLPSGVLSTVAIITSIISIVFSCLPFLNSFYITTCWLSYVFGVSSIILSAISLLRKNRYAFLSLIIAICATLLPIILAPEYASIAIGIAKSGSLGIIETINDIINSFK